MPQLERANEFNRAEIKKFLYTAKTGATPGRNGISPTINGQVDVTQPPPGDLAANSKPDQLLAARWSACFTNAMKLTAARMKVEIPAEAAIEAEVELRTGNDGYFLEARLNVSLPGLEREVAQALLEATDQTCPYANFWKRITTWLGIPARFARH